MDRLSAFLMRFGYTVETFFHGQFCGDNLLPAKPGTGHLHLVRHGQIWLHHDDGPPLPVDGPAVILYPQPCAHRIVARDHAELLCATIVSHGSADGLIRTLPRVIPMPLAQMPALAVTFNLLFEEAGQQGYGQKLILDRLCDVLLLQALREMLAQRGGVMGRVFGLSDSTLSRAILAMHAEPGARWTVDTLAGLCGMSRSKFAQRFHAVVGIPPAEYLLEQRIHLAKRLLARGRQVQEIAAEVGYSTQPAFTRAFRTTCKMTPREWLARRGGL
ncbi:MAG: AraC family transcriptional regulator [Burkholderiaceae bacterium]|nr:AraC family transcriptional regulator [Burkholderiaceae bacterium]